MRAKLQPAASCSARDTRRRERLGLCLLLSLLLLAVVQQGTPRLLRALNARAVSDNAAQQVGAGVEDAAQLAAMEFCSRRGRPSETCQGR